MSIAGTVVVLNGPTQGRQFAISQQLQQLAHVPFNALGLEILQKQFIPPEPHQTKQQLLSLNNSAYILGLNAAISGMARRGCNVVVDHTLLNRADYDALRELLIGIDVVWIAIQDDSNTPLYENIPYDLSFNTATSDQEVALKITSYLKDRPMKTMAKYRWAADKSIIDEKFKRGSLVVLYGTTSAGKSTLSRALQMLSPEVFFHMGVTNTALSILPREYLGVYLKKGEAVEQFKPTEKQRQGTYILPPNSHENPTPYLRQQIGYFGRQTVRGIFSAIAMMCATGINVVSDQVFLFDDWYFEAIHEFAGLPILWVSVSPDLQEIARREAMRPERIPGFSLGHHHQMYKNIPSDITLADNRASPEENARNILTALREKKIMSV